MVLIIDDDPEIRELLREYVEELDYEVLEASSVPESIKLLRTKKVSFVVCDIVLASGSGQSVYSYVRKSHSAFHQIPFLFISGQASPTKELDHKTRFLAKPFTKQEFHEIFHFLLQKNSTPEAPKSGREKKVLHPALETILKGKK